MQVITIPIEIRCMSSRASVKEFMDYIFSTGSHRLEKQTSSEVRNAYYSQDEKFYSIFFLSRKIKSVSCRINDSGSKRQLFKEDFYDRADGDFNLLVLKKGGVSNEYLKGVYLQYNGSFSLYKFKENLCRDFISYLRDVHGEQKRGEKLIVSNITDNETLLDKIKKLSTMKKLSMTMKLSKTVEKKSMSAGNRFEEISDTVHIEYRGKGFFSGEIEEHLDIIEEIERIASRKDCMSLSAYGQKAGLGVEGTVNILNASNNIKSEPFEDVVASLNECFVDDVMSSLLFENVLKDIESDEYSHLFD